jgi:hypothetical protein
LNSDSELRALVTGIFDEVPEGQVHPYVVLGEAFETPDNTHDTFGREVVITLHTWSRYRGYAEVLRITDRIITLLDHQPLSITGHNVIAVRHEFAQTLRDPDPEIRHVPIRFRVVTEQDTT